MRLGFALAGLLALVLAPASGVAQEWKQVVTPAHRDLLARTPEIVADVNAVLARKAAPGSADAAALAEVKALLARKHKQIADTQLPGNWKCKFYWMQHLGAFEYPFFRCRIGRRDGYLFFQKLNGSVRQQALMYRDGKSRFVLPMSVHVMDEPPQAYGTGGNANPDRAGELFLLDRKTAIVLIPVTATYYELLLLKR